MSETQYSPYVPGPKLPILGMVIPPFIGILIMGPYKPLLLGWWPFPMEIMDNNGSLEPSPYTFCLSEFNFNCLLGLAMFSFTVTDLQDLECPGRIIDRHGFLLPSMGLVYFYPNYGFHVGEYTKNMDTMGLATFQNPNSWVQTQKPWIKTGCLAWGLL